jgi:hypothetical protein
MKQHAAKRLDSRPIKRVFQKQFRKTVAPPPEPFRRRCRGPKAAVPPADSTTAYLAHMTGELAKLARGAGLDLLSYLLDMAKLEAASQCSWEWPNSRGAPRGDRAESGQAPEAPARLRRDSMSTSA